MNWKISPIPIMWIWQGWPIVVKAIQRSAKLLAAVLDRDGEAVASGIAEVHMQENSILRYNDENSLALTVTLAFYAAKEKYTIVREFPTGKGFADLVFLPRPKCSEPILLIELKWNQSAQTAIDQILERHYPDSLLDRTGALLIVGITYDKETKKHSCSIQKVEL